MSKVVVVGEINVDLICQGYSAFPAPGREILVDDFVTTLGSSSAICAAGLARLGTDVVFVGKVGADLWGDYCLQAMSSAGIDVSRVRRDPLLKTGVTVSITSAQDRALVSFPGSVAELSADEVDDDALAGADHLHVSSYFLQTKLRRGCSGLFARASAAGLTTSLDPGCDPEGRWDRDLLATLREVDVFFPNELELAAITGEPDLAAGLRRLANGRTQTIVTLGASGCATLSDGELLPVPAFAIQPVDTTGAGDSFNAGFLHAKLSGLPLRECLRWGAAAGSLSTRGLGGTARQASIDEMRALLAADR
ncbi:MAG TPA: carbohydrate kinase family protein [Steroidobacteraceae bacterium]|nr:carbohydrate kinase family protein [Steroidobacteraceae bacterium]